MAILCFSCWILYPFFFHYLGHAFLREWLLPLKLFSLEPFTWFRSLCLGLPGCHIFPVILLSLHCDCISPIFPHDVTNWMKKFLHPRLASKHWKSILSVTLKWKWLRTIIFFSSLMSLFCIFYPCIAWFTISFLEEEGEKIPSEKGAFSAAFARVEWLRCNKVEKRKLHHR